MLCVEIEMNDAGEYSVGICPPESENEPKEHLNPMGSLEEALAQAKAMLAGSQQSPQDAVISEMGFAG